MTIVTAEDIKGEKIPQGSFKLFTGVNKIPASVMHRYSSGKE